MLHTAFSQSPSPSHDDPAFPGPSTSRVPVNQPKATLDLTHSANKKRKLARACDACRRRKTKCDGPKMPDNICSNCLQTKKPCTYVEASKPRGPPKAYITGLEDKMEKLEALLKQLRPDTDFSAELGPPVIRDSWKMDITIGREPNTSPTALSSATSHSSSSTTRRAAFMQRPRSMGDISSVLVGAPPVPRASHLVSKVRSSARGIADRNDSDDDMTSLSESSASEGPEVVDDVSGSMTKLKLRGRDHAPEDLVDNHARFHGKSSALGLVEVTRKFKKMHWLEQEGTDSSQSPASTEAETQSKPITTRRPQFWRTPPWERAWEGIQMESSDLFASTLAEFPPSDLAKELIDIYFARVNELYPLLHRPTFYRQWNENLHQRNIWFAAVCLAVFAVASRWCNDERILKGNARTASGGPDWSVAGWNFFEMVVDIHRARRSLFYPVTLYEIQTFTLLGMFLRGSDAHPAAWIIINVGMRKAQDVGAHRRKMYQDHPTVDDEQWKRAFWCLVVFDRIGGASLGRGCGIGDEDFDVEMPLEVDEQFWETEGNSTAFWQPEGLPCKGTAFILLIKLTQIMAFALRTVYAIDKSKVFYGMVGRNWRKEVIEQLTSLMTEWMESVPAHLVWSQDMAESPFKSQATALRIFYLILQMLVFRPFIYSSHTTISSDGSAARPLFSRPAMDICVEAARSCARIAETELQRGLPDIPTILHGAHLAAGLLLVRIWDLKGQEKRNSRAGMEDVKPPIAQQIEPLVDDVKIFIAVLERAEPRWKFAAQFLQQLRQSLPASDNSEVSQDLRDMHTQATNNLPWFTPPIHVSSDADPHRAADPYWQWQTPSAPTMHDTERCSVCTVARDSTAYERKLSQYDHLPPHETRLVSSSQNQQGYVYPQAQADFPKESYFSTEGGWTLPPPIRTVHPRARTPSISSTPASHQTSYATRRLSYPSYAGNEFYVEDQTRSVGDVVYHDESMRVAPMDHSRLQYDSLYQHPISLWDGRQHQHYGNVTNSTSQ